MPSKEEQQNRLANTPQADNLSKMNFVSQEETNKKETNQTPVEKADPKLHPAFSIKDDGSINKWNADMSEITGYSEEEALSSRIDDLVTITTRDHINTHIDNIM